MKGTICIALLTALISFLAGAQSLKISDRAADEEAIRRVVAQSDDNWNQHEYSRNAELRIEDAVDVNVVGQRMHRSEIWTSPPQWFQKAFAASTLHSTVIWTKFIKPDVAAVDVEWEMTGARCPDGSDDAKQQTYRKGLMSLVMTKQRGHWLIAVFHNMDLPAAPPGSTQIEVPCQFRSAPSPRPSAAPTP